MKFYALWISLICIVIFIIQLAIPGFTETFYLGSEPLSQPWQFVTAIFLHGSLVHLVYNLFALVFFGLVLEKLISSKNFLIVFFATGIFANIISFNFYPASLGASGAILGLIGTLAIVRPMMMVFVGGMMLPMFVAAIFWVIGDFLGIFSPDNVGHIAHLSGIFLGFVLGIYFRTRYREKKKMPKKIWIDEKDLRKFEEKHMLR